MRGSLSGIVGTIAALATLHVQSSTGSQVAAKTPQYQLLPSLREQADIVDAWTEERKALIPGLLQKYGVDAWLVCFPESIINSTFFLSLTHTHSFTHLPQQQHIHRYGEV